MFYMEISSKTGYNVHEAFYKMAFEVNEVQKRKIHVKASQPRGPYAEDENQKGGVSYKVSLRP